MLYFASLRYIEQKNQQLNQEEDTDTVTTYLFLAKIRCRFSKLPNIGIPCIFRQFSVHWTKICDWGQNKTNRVIPINRLLSRYTSFWQNIRCRFSFGLGFRGRMVFLAVAKKRRRCCVLPLLLSGLSVAAAANKSLLCCCFFCCVQCLGDFHLHCTRHASCARVPQRAAKARSHRTDDRRLARS